MSIVINEVVMKEEEQTYRFGELVKLYRSMRGLTLKALADQANVSQSYIQRMEFGERNAPTVMIFLKLCLALGIDVIDGLKSFKDFDREEMIPVAQFEDIHTLKYTLQPGTTNEKKECLENVLFALTNQEIGSVEAMEACLQAVKQLKA